MIIVKPAPTPLLLLLPRRAMARLYNPMYIFVKNAVWTILPLDWESKIRET